MRDKSALRFIALLGVVSLFADMTYEGARSVAGPFLSVLGAGAATVGVVAGAGELIGYGLRVVSGWISDRTQKYWTITITGYGVNLLAVPLLALAGRWEVAALLLMAERLGKAVRTPARDAMLSYATRSVGRGWGFALHEALDQVGAVLGPIVVAVALTLPSGYSGAFAVLAFPAVLALVLLAAARLIYPNPREFEPPAAGLGAKILPGRFWLYSAGAALIAAGSADFALIAYHFKQVDLVRDSRIAVLYAGAMGVDALAALILGRWYDRRGIVALMPAAAVSAFFAPAAFSTRIELGVIGIMCWGVGMGAQESVLRAAVADIVSPQRRATAYGVFNMVYGLAWFVGSALMGILYEISLSAMILFSVLLQLASLPVIYAVHRRSRKSF